MKEKANQTLERSRGVFESIKNFLLEVQLETKKVSWPDRKNVLAFFVVVIIILLLCGFFIWAVDVGLLKLIDYLVVRF
jgi:preprotein translocase subunit SecE